MKLALSVPVLFIALFLALLTATSYALSEQAEAAKNALAQAEVDAKSMQDAGFGIQRVNDMLTEARIILDAQLQNEKQGEPADFTPVMKKVQEIGAIREQAFGVSDELKALELAIQESGNSMDVSGVQKVFSEARQEFLDERYEQSRELIEKAYTQLLEVEARSTTAAALYEATAGTLTNFIATNWKEISAVLMLLVLFLFIAHKRIAIHKLNRKIRKLEIERASIEELIKKTQKEYFEKGKIPESTYNIRIKKFAELIRDINRQVPLLREQLAKKKGVKLKAGKKAVIDLTGKLKPALPVPVSRRRKSVVILERLPKPLRSGRE